MTKYFVLCFLFCFPVIIYGQETNLSDIIVEIAEELAADESDPEAAGTYVDWLHDLAENPVNLNSSDEDEISRLFFLSDFQVKALIDYTQKSGKIVSVFEIANIPGFDKETTRTMIPFIALDKVRTNVADSARWRSTLITSLTEKPGSDDSSTLGSSLKFLTRYKFTAGSFSGGITLEKDPGEKFLTGHPPLPDFFSANITFNGRGLIRRIIIGDFSARFGQGTNINSGFRSALALTSPGYMAARNEIKQYTSTDENSFFRGMAAELSSGRLGLSVFYSSNNFDATPGTYSDQQGEYIENSYTSGIHVTSSQIRKKDVASDMAYGLNFSINLNSVRFGIAWSEDKLSLPLMPPENDAKSIFNFRGDKKSVGSFYYNSLIKRILLYGEVSSDESFRFAFVQGMSFRPSDRLNVNFLFRKYENGYFSIHGKGPGTGSTAGNGEGILGNFTFEAAKHLFLSAGCDIQHFSWLKYRCSGPSDAVKQEVKIKFNPDEKLALEASYNYRMSMVDNSGDSGIPDQMEIRTKSIRISSHYTPYINLTLGTRCETKVESTSGSRGSLLSQDAVYRLRKIPVTIWLRYCLYRTDDWASRLYVYENDLLYSFSIPALSGEGSRSYVMIKWEINQMAEVRLKYGITSLSEGHSEVNNNDELKFQLKIRF